MNVAVVEDNLLDMRTLKKTLRDYAGDVDIDLSISTFVSGSEFRESFKGDEYSIIFLDIYIGEEHGNDIARWIRTIDKDVAIVFTTMSPDFAVEGFAVRAMHYILKPVTKAEIAETFSRYFAIHERMIKRKKQVTLPCGKVDLTIEVERILYLERDNRETVMHSELGVHRVMMTLRDIMDMLPEDMFIRTHKSYIVNMSAVDHLADDGFHMRDGAIVPIRVNGGGPVRLKYMQFVAGNKKR